MLLAELREAAADFPQTTSQLGYILQELAPALSKRKFKSVMGCSPKKYITACFMHKACVLLCYSNKKIIEIASLCGFSDVSSFNRCFIKHLGQAPNKFMRNYSQTTE